MQLKTSLLLVHHSFFLLTSSASSQRWTMGAGRVSTLSRTLAGHRRQSWLALSRPFLLFSRTHNPSPCLSVSFLSRPLSSPPPNPHSPLHHPPSSSLHPQVLPPPSLTVSTPDTPSSLPFSPKALTAAQKGKGKANVPAERRLVRARRSTASLGLAVGMGGMGGVSERKEVEELVKECRDRLGEVTSGFECLLRAKADPFRSQMIPLQPTPRRRTARPSRLSSLQPLLLNRSNRRRQSTTSTPLRHRCRSSIKQPLLPRRRLRRLRSGW